MTKLAASAAVEPSSPRTSAERPWSGHSNAEQALHCCSWTFVSAFDNAIRETVFLPGSMDDAAVANLFARLSLPPEQLWNLLFLLSDNEAARQQAGVPGPLSGMVREWHDCSWVGIQGGHEVIDDRRDSKPGDALGDIVFNFARGCALRRVIDSLRELGLATIVPYAAAYGPFSGPEPDANAEVIDAAYVDDEPLCICVGETPRSWYTMLLPWLTPFPQKRKRFGFAFNTSPGKTEIMPAFRGAGARKKATQELQAKGLTLKNGQCIRSTFWLQAHGRSSDCHSSADP